MKFGPVPIEEAEGKILGHNIAGPHGRRALRKGKPITKADIAVLRSLEKITVYAAELEPGDLNENEAASRIAAAIAGPGVQLSAPGAGRVNLTASGPGVLRVDPERLQQVNEIEGVTVASLASFEPVRAGQIAASVKIVPYGLAERLVEPLESPRSTSGAIIRVDPFIFRQVALIFFASPKAREKVQGGFERPIRARLEALGSEISSVAFVPLEDLVDEEQLADVLGELESAGAELIILAGETAIMDRHDLAPRAVERAGGQVEAVGVPVDPGNLLMLAYLRQVPVLGAPGCVRSRKKNVVDLLLPRLLAGDRVSRAELIALGHGGLLEDTPKRPMPRNKV